MVTRAVVGAHYGLRDWLAQRLTAIVMALYTLLLIIVMLRAPILDFEGWRNVFEPQWMRLATLLFIVSLCLHAWIGVRNIFMDYVKSGGMRLALYTLAIAWLVICAGWAVQILWSL